MFVLFLQKMDKNRTQETKLDSWGKQSNAKLEINFPQTELMLTPVPIKNDNSSWVVCKLIKRRSEVTFRSVRQGDPLSMYLFVLYRNPLIALLHQICSDQHDLINEAQSLYKKKKTKKKQNKIFQILLSNM